MTPDVEGERLKGDEAGASTRSLPDRTGVSATWSGEEAGTRTFCAVGVAVRVVCGGDGGIAEAFEPASGATTGDVERDREVGVDALDRRFALSDARALARSYERLRELASAAGPQPAKRKSTYSHDEGEVPA